MKRITKKVRDEAALICAIAASTRKHAVYVSDVVLWKDGDLAVWSAAASLASDAIVYVESHASHHPAGPNAGWDRGNCAEAEALLRTGWLP